MILAGLISWMKQILSSSLSSLGVKMLNPWLSSAQTIFVTTFQVVLPKAKLCQPQRDLFDYNIATPLNCNVLPGKMELEEEENEGDESSATTTTTPTKKSTAKADRSRTLISERKRRGRMKEKLYALRSLVPNITKMDKASIIGDALLYIQELQMQAKKLKAEIAGLESSLIQTNDCQGESFQNDKKPTVAINLSVNRKIFQMEVFQVEEREFYGRIVSNKGQGIAALLYKALESLVSFTVHSSNLSSAAENYVLTFTLHVEEFEVDIVNLPNLKMWVASAFVNQGFYIVQLPSA